ncbi:MAG: hypothetical protein WBA93_35690 [Microcoleaceae cyanobacterium]
MYRELDLGDKSVKKNWKTPMELKQILETDTILKFYIIAQYISHLVLDLVAQDYCRQESYSH